MARQVMQPQQNDQLKDTLTGVINNYTGGVAGRFMDNKQQPQSQQADFSQDTAEQQMPEQSQPLQNQGAGDLSTPRERYMQSMQQSPVFQLRQGKAALAGMSSDDRALYDPYISEALKRAKQDQYTA